MIAAAPDHHRFAAKHVSPHRHEAAEILPFLPLDEPDEPSDLDDPSLPWPDDDHWDAFLPDDDPNDPLPAPGDFWIDADSD